MIFAYSAFLFVFSFFAGVLAPENLQNSSVPVDDFISPDKDTIDLSKYKGKVVVLSFWSSWSKASRVENKNLVRIYQKNLTSSKVVFISVSLDTDETSWKMAIEEDDLDWKNHYCDFKKYDSPIAKSFKVNTLPVIFLYDKTGKHVRTVSKVQEVESDIDAMLN